MEIVKPLIPLFLALSLGGLVAGVGIRASAADLIYLFRRPARLLEAVLAVNVIVPIVAVIVTQFLPVTPFAKAGIVLMAISPVPPLVPGKQLKAGGRQDYAFGAYAALAGLAVITVPVSVAILNLLYPVTLVIPPGAILRNVALSVFAPLLLGLTLHRFAPAFAERVAPIVEKAAMGLLLIVLALILVKIGPSLPALIGHGEILAVVLVVAAGLIAGHVLGGTDPRDKAALAAAASTRHPGIAMLIGTASFNEPRVTAAIVGFLLVGLVATLPYSLWIKRRIALAAA